MKLSVCKNNVLACLCGLGRQNVFIYLKGKLWCSIKTECEVVDMKLVENECSIIVGYTNNKCSKFEIFDKTQRDSKIKTWEGMSDLDKTLQIMSNPTELVAKPVFPQNRNMNKESQKLHFVSKDCVIQESGESSLPLLLKLEEAKAEAVCFELDKEKFSELGIRKV